MAVAAALSAVMAHFVFYYNWSWMECFLFGSIISATDPVAVVALLSSLGEYILKVVGLRSLKIAFRPSFITTKNIILVKIS